MTPALVRSRRRSRPSGHRRKRRTEGLRPSEPPPKGANSPLLKPPFCRPSHVTVFLGVVVSLKILTPKNAGFSDSRHSQGKGRWSRASIDPYPSLVFRAPPLTRSGVPPETPQPYSFAASLMRCGPSAQAPFGGTSPLRTTPQNHARYGYGIWDSHGRGRSTSPPPCGHLSFVICHIIFRT